MEKKSEKARARHELARLGMGTFFLVIISGSTLYVALACTELNPQILSPLSI